MSIKLFYKPLSIIVVDDDKNVLINIKQQFSNREVFTFTDTDDLQSNIKPLMIHTNDFLTEFFQNTISLNYNKIKYLFDTISNYHSILIADFSMPKLNGLDLISKYNNTEMINILLTNIYPLNSILDALNQKLIDYFLPKDDIVNILEVVNNLECKFLTNFTKNILKCLSKEELVFLNDKNFIDIFDKVISKYKITNYCLLNAYGAYYLDNGVDKYILSIYSNSDLEDFSRDYTGDLKRNIIEGNVIPSYFSNDGNSFVNAQKSYNYSYSIEKILN